MESKAYTSVAPPSTPVPQEANSPPRADTFRTQDSPCSGDMAGSFDFLDWDSSSRIYSQDDSADSTYEAKWTLLSKKRFSQLPLLPSPLFSPKLISEPFEPPQTPRKSPEQFRRSMRQYMEAKSAESKREDIDCMGYLDVKDIAACMRVDSRFYDLVCKSWRAREKGWFGPLQLPMEVETRILSRPDTDDFYVHPFLAVGLPALNKASVPFSWTEHDFDKERDVWVLKVLIPVSALIKCSNGRTVSGLLDSVMRAVKDEEEKPEPRPGSFQDLLRSMDLMPLQIVEQARMDARREVKGSIERRRGENGGSVVQETPSARCEPEMSLTKASKRPKTHTTRLPIHYRSTLWKKIFDARHFLPTSGPSPASSQQVVPKVKLSSVQSPQKLAQSSSKYGLSQLPLPSSKPVPIVKSTSKVATGGPAWKTRY